jgi:hypothetical protein
MIKTLTLGAVLAATVALTACATTQATTPRTAVASSPSLTVQTANGTGCPAGTVATTTSSSDVTATYTAFTVTAGVGGRKACQLNVLVHPGANNQAVVTNANHVGTATLPAGASGTVKTTYYVTAGTNLAVTSSPLAAPSWNVNQAPPTSTVVTACGTDVALNVKTELTVTGTGAQAAAQSSDVHVDWQSC